MLLQEIEDLINTLTDTDNSIKQKEKARQEILEILRPHCQNLKHKERLSVWDEQVAGYIELYKRGIGIPPYDSKDVAQDIAELAQEIDNENK